mmetsp:Transcript_2210/g.2763  ORF Transcript_2210/g.2763 Transcript_2210/m.2763 type:complete len:185 (+) Transcript_2210:43-597(+)|eukprot:jgi/Bigna1/87118/estExt_fgenesh1_pg.C_170010
MDNDLSGQLFLALLRQLVKRGFYGESGAMDKEVQDKIFSDSKMGSQKINDFLGSCERLLRRAGRGNWTLSRFEQEVDQQELSDEHKKVLSHVWKTESTKIHKAIVSKTVWNNDLREFSWRIDVKSNSKNIPDINEPTAIIRLSLKNQDKVSDVVHCELDRNGLDKVIAELDKIESHIDNISSQS